MSIRGGNLPRAKEQRGPFSKGPAYSSKHDRSYVFNEEEASLLKVLMKRAMDKSLGREGHKRGAHVYIRDAFSAMMVTLYERDPWAKGHLRRVTKLATNTARRLGLSEDDIGALRLGGYIPDIGKLGISSGIITKPGKLSNEEFNAVKTHPLMGEMLAKDLGMSQKELSVVKHHHERWDGKGYPEGLAGEKIPFLARLLAVVDAYDAMTSYRPYKNAMSSLEAESELREKTGWQFDGEIVRVFIKGRS